MQAQWKGLLSMLEQEESFENSLWIDIKLQKMIAKICVIQIYTLY